MIDLHYWTTPNGHKITIFLEEAGLPYRVIPVNIGAGDQFAPEFLAIAPNNRIRRLRITMQPAAPSAFLNRARSCGTWRKKPVCFYPPMLHNEPRRSNG